MEIVKESKRIRINEPLGLPKGSVQAIVIILLVMAVVFPVAAGVLRNEDLHPNTQQFLTAVVVAVVGLIKDYMNHRNATAPATQEQV